MIGNLPVDLTDAEADVIKAMEIKVVGEKFYKINNECDLDKTILESLTTKALINCASDGLFLTPEGRVVRNILFIAEDDLF